MPALSDRAVRVELGIPRSVAARLAGVARHTMTLYEMSPTAVRPSKRVELERFYSMLRHVLTRCPGFKGES